MNYFEAKSLAMKKASDMRFVERCVFEGVVVNDNGARFRVKGHGDVTYGIYPYDPDTRPEHDPAVDSGAMFRE